MEFAAKFGRACGIEIAQTHEAQSVSLSVPMAGSFKRELRFSIRIRRMRGIRFLDEGLLRFTIDGRGRGKYQAGNSGGAHGLKQHQAGNQIIGIIFFAGFSHDSPTSALAAM